VLSFVTIHCSAHDLQSKGAVAMDEWTVYRVAGDALDKLAASFNSSS
jgi:hypothetical protein